MEQHEAWHLHQILSHARLPEYGAFCASDPVAALRLFCWNTEVSAALDGPLQVLELAVRSVLDQRMCQLFGRDDWWAHPRARLHRPAQLKVDEAAAQLRRQG